MFTMANVIKFEIKNDKNATWKFIRHISENEVLNSNWVSSSWWGDTYTAYFKQKAREELTRYIANEISKSDN